MMRIIKQVGKGHSTAVLDFVEQVFCEHQDAEEGRLVRQLVEEIRRKRYYLPELEPIMAFCPVRICICPASIV